VKIDQWIDYERWANLECPFTVSHDVNTELPVEVRLQNNNDGLVLFVINHSGTNKVVREIDIQNE